MNQHVAAPETFEEPPVWERYSVKEVRFETEFVLTKEGAPSRETALSTFRRFLEDVAYREQDRPCGYPVERIEAWQEGAVRALEEALESPNFRRFETEVLGSVRVVFEARPETPAPEGEGGDV